CARGDDYDGWFAYW
nr:immunoglobulin heavy chain junction region [Mus musculus]NSM06245.1 immunoglobulin heavy chain junction region [Mus musculus]NSM06493.1 immunoglobulin heavy chain junction region [Mus musculus]NSM06640.1 immunoglobulin heavy chain junction region [Mus musculus]NSM06641.1 immunoglobulin heavy chain junction region [Mus musculus]